MAKNNKNKKPTAKASNNATEIEKSDVVLSEVKVKETKEDKE